MATYLLLKCSYYCNQLVANLFPRMASRLSALTTHRRNPAVVPGLSPSHPALAQPGTLSLQARYPTWQNSADSIREPILHLNAKALPMRYANTRTLSVHNPFPSCFLYSLSPIHSSSSASSSSFTLSYSPSNYSICSQMSFSQLLDGFGLTGATGT